MSFHAIAALALGAALAAAGALDAFADGAAEASGAGAAADVSDDALAEAEGGASAGGCDPPHETRIGAAQASVKKSGRASRRVKFMETSAKSCEL